MYRSELQSKGCRLKICFDLKSWLAIVVADILNTNDRVHNLSHIRSIVNKEPVIMQDLRDDFHDGRHRKELINLVFT